MDLEIVQLDLDDGFWRARVDMVLQRLCVICEIRGIVGGLAYGDRASSDGNSRI